MKKKYNNEEIIKGKVTYMPINCKKQAFVDKKKSHKLRNSYTNEFQDKLCRSD